MTKRGKKSGYSMVEIIIYISILTILTVIVINTVISFSSSYKNLRVLRVIEHSATDAMERMTRDIRSASSIDAGSTLGSSPGILVLISVANGFSTTTKFYLDNSILKVDVNGTYFGPLSLTNAKVTNLIFTSLTSSVSRAVKIDMTVEATVGSVTKNKTYHSTIILRGQ